MNKEQYKELARSQKIFAHGRVDLPLQRSHRSCFEQWPDLLPQPEWHRGLSRRAGQIIAVREPDETSTTALFLLLGERQGPKYLHIVRFIYSTTHTRNGIHETNETNRTGFW